MYKSLVAKIVQAYCHWLTVNSDSSTLPSSFNKKKSDELENSGVRIYELTPPKFNIDAKK